MIHALVGFVLNLTFRPSLVRRVNCGRAAVEGSLIALNAIRIVRMSILGFIRFRVRGQKAQSLDTQDFRSGNGGTGFGEAYDYYGYLDT